MPNSILSQSGGILVHSGVGGKKSSLAKRNSKIILKNTLILISPCFFFYFERLFYSTVLAPLAGTQTDGPRATQLLGGLALNTVQCLEAKM